MSHYKRFTDLQGTFNEMIQKVDNNINVIAEHIDRSDTTTLFNVLTKLESTNNIEERNKTLMRFIFGQQLAVVEDEIAKFTAIIEDTMNVLDYILDKTRYINNHRMNWKLLNDDIRNVLTSKMGVLLALT